MLDESVVMRPPSGSKNDEKSLLLLEKWSIQLGSFEKSQDAKPSDSIRVKVSDLLDI